MAEILKEWLSERLQRPIKWETEEFGEIMKNGQVISNILLSYHIINEDKYFLIRSSNAVDDINNNWHYLTGWLREVEIHITDIDLKNLKDGKGSTLLRLFYQLFLHLDKRDRINYIKKERKLVSSLVEKLENRFKVDKVDEEEESDVNELSKPLLNEKHFIEWQRKKEAQVKETYDFMRYKYVKICDKIKESQIPIESIPSKPHKFTFKDKLDIEKFSQKYPTNFCNYTYDELVNMEQQANDNKTPIIDSEWAKTYMDNLHSKLHNKSASQKFQKQLSNVLTTSLWDMSVAEEETKFETELAKKVIKLSQFEKQMCTQVMETKQQARNLLKNRIQAEKEFTDQRDHQFNQYLDNVKEQIHLDIVEIDFEKDRQNMLHRRLYAEKMKRKRQHYYEICYETMLSIVDYATKFAYYKRLIGDDIPEHFIREWKALYYKRQPIFDLLQQVEDVLEEHGIEEEMAPEEETIIREELDRQDCINESDFSDYHNYSGLWELEKLIPNFEPDSEDRKWEYLGIRILGHVVYTLLEIKYPYPPRKLPADLPEFESKALLRSLPDRSITVPMQILLNKRKIHVIRLEAAINYCLKSYKTEMIGCQDIEIPFEKFITLAPDECKDLIRLIKLEDSKTDVVAAPIPPNTKQIQTPKTIPEEEIVLSNSAELGKYAYEAFGLGDTLTDHLLAAMIVEYLKDQDDINGFVIINYPNTYRETQILEETFSGRAPPDEADLDDRDEIYLEDSIQKHRKKEKDPFKNDRISRLVEDPHKKSEEPPYTSYFTSYIKLKDTEDILQEDVIWLLTDENSDIIDRFYASLGLNYSMYHEIIDKDFLSQICKYIIGELNLPMKSTDNLFGEGILSTLDFPTTEDKRQKSKIVKPEILNGKSKEKLRKGSKSSKQTIEQEKSDSIIRDESVVPEAIQSLIILEEVEDDINSKSIQLEDIKIEAGEEDWVYGDLPIPEQIGIALATIWQKIESAYINDMEQLFFSKRLQINSLVPYARFLKDKMHQIITLPSNKQDIVVKFQTEYNDFEDDWRNTNVSKNEWHCRIRALQNKLYNICDERKLFAERQRQCLIIDSWSMEELTCMVNTYISCMQTELNRAVLTYQILHDFYLTLLKHSPTSDRLASKDLNKISREIDDGMGNKKLSPEDKLFRQLKNAFLDMQLRNTFIDVSNNPFNLIIENNIKFALKVIKDLNDSYRSIISKEYAEVSKVTPPPRKKDDPVGSTESIPKEEIYKMNGFKCIEEWTNAINGEMYRFNLRILALQNRCYRDMKLFNDYIYKTFMDIQNSIDTYYMNEIKSVDRLCKYLQMAVENGRKVEESLILEHDTFIIDPNLLQYAPPEVKSDTAIIERVGDNEFKIGQLARLRSYFKLVSPNGISMEKPFIYLLQDFIFYSKENCEGTMVPKIWKKFDPEAVPKLMYLIYGETVYVDWRDFLIFCLNLRYPTIDELLELRRRLRCNDEENTEIINREIFINEILWFESDFDVENPYSCLRFNLIKHFLFELFEVSPDMMNYSAFLLAFSKHQDPIVGFTTAISMATGRKLCYVSDECNAVVQKLIKLKEYKDACKKCANKCSAEFIETLLNKVIIECEGITITEYEQKDLVTDKKKKGKGITTQKSKIEGTQSARLPKRKSFTSKTKVAQSATDVKTTFICKPCEEVQVDDKPEEIPESRRSLSPQPDPDLDYCVSQDVIWTILKTCLPWPFEYIPEQKVPTYVEDMKNVFTSLENDTEDGKIYICKLVQNPFVCKLLHKIKKFYAINLMEEVNKLIAH